MTHRTERGWLQPSAGSTLFVPLRNSADLHGLSDYLLRDIGLDREGSVRTFCHILPM